MGRPPKKTRQIEMPGVTVTVPNSTAADDKELDDFTQDEMDQVAGVGDRPPVAKIMRYDPDLKDYALLDTVPVANATDEYVKDTFGGGKYRIYFNGMRPDGTYGHLKKQTRMFTIDSSIPFKGTMKDRVTLHNADGSRADGGVTKSLLEGQLIELFRAQSEGRAHDRESSQQMTTMMMQMMQQTTQMMMALMNRPQATGPDIMPVLLAMINNKKDLDPLQLVTLIQTAGAQKGSLAETIAAIKDIKELSGMFGEGGGAEEGPWGIVAKVVPDLVGIMRAESAKTQAPVALPPVRTNPRIGATDNGSGALPGTRPMMPVTDVNSPSGAGGGTGASPVHGETMTDEWTALEPHIPMLAMFAEQDKDPRHVVGMVLAFMPEDQVEALAQMVDNEELGAVLVQRFPALQPHREWVEDLLDEFRDEFTPDDDTESREASIPMPGEEGADHDQ